ncbi:UpxY family transcription antiterminator [Leeuwenhoekiella marinoflava]|uniref:UpxY family transcription antiterminator n=1 Tax=Leeuwenhoekiella marinoflava TaxID=988 RepID=UPI0030033677
MRWYVLYVRSRQELKIESYINKLDADIEAFCPSVIQVKKWSDRTKKIRVPLMPSIVLIKTKEKFRDRVFEIAGTSKYLFWENRPAVVREDEIDNLKSISSFTNINSYEVTQLRAGSKIDLTSLGFTNFKGIIDKKSKNKCWVILESLGYTVKIILN